MNTDMSNIVDLIILSRDREPLDHRVAAGVSSQLRVDVRVHRIVGKPAPEDRTKWQTIARVRNIARNRGRSQWVMFLDDDVVLERNCIAALLDELKQDKSLAAVGAPYLFTANPFFPPDSYHVTMGATLFRRSAFDKFEFRSTPSRCDCSCCCEDLNRQFMRIKYCLNVQAHHVDIGGKSQHHTNESHTDYYSNKEDQPKTILAAFDHRDVNRFRRQFLTSLRRCGNREKVIAFAYGLSLDELRGLGAEPNVTVVEIPNERDCPARLRLRDFQIVTKRLHKNAPVAYWDAGDVVFQSDLSELWQQILNAPDKLLVTCQQSRIKASGGCMSKWIQTITDEDQRAKVASLLNNRLCFNSGFAAGTAATMTKYFSAADELMNSATLSGTTDWGDQLAMNFYCYTDSDRFVDVGNSWNYVLYDRFDHRAKFTDDGWYTCASPQQHIRVVHGAGGTLHRIPGYLGFRNSPVSLFKPRVKAPVV